MSKPTPGPWKSKITSKNSATRNICACRPGEDGSKDSHYDLCVVREIFKPGNAFLIAAAPEMLDALEYVKDFLDKRFNGLSMDLVENAIKKAKGEEINDSIEIGMV